MAMRDIGLVIVLVAVAVCEASRLDARLIEKLLERSVKATRTIECVDPWEAMSLSMTKPASSGCYMVQEENHQDYLTYEEAQEYCETLGGDLASFETETEMDGFLQWFHRLVAPATGGGHPRPAHDLYRQHWLSGLRNSMKDGRYAYIWATDEKVLKNMWDKSYDGTEQGRNDGTVLYNRKIKALPTNSRQPAICELAATVIIEEPTDAFDDCADACRNAEENADVKYFSQCIKACVSENKTTLDECQPTK